MRESSSAPVPFPSNFWRKVVQESIDARREVDKLLLDLSELDVPKPHVGGLDGGEARKRPDVASQFAELQRELAEVEAYLLVVGRHAGSLSLLGRSFKRLRRAMF